MADKVLLKVDFRNAFNSVDRFGLLSETRAAFPGLACWVDWCYGSASILRFGKHTIPSTRGIQQGDPLGPLLFAACGKLRSARWSSAFHTWMMLCSPAEPMRWLLPLQSFNERRVLQAWNSNLPSASWRLWRLRRTSRLSHLRFK